MLALTKATGYAILALGCLDCQEEKSVVSTREISEGFDIPGELLAKVLQRLSRQGILKAHQGRGGGYSLERPITEISVGEVVEAVEGPIAIAVCLKDGGQELCDLFENCTIRTPVGHIQQKLTELFASIMISDIASGIDLCPRKGYLSQST